MEQKAKLQMLSRKVFEDNIVCFRFDKQQTIIIIVCSEDTKVEVAVDDANDQINSNNYKLSTFKSMAPGTSMPKTLP